jgi:hypothetical protein
MNRRDIFKWITGAVIAPVAPEQVVAAVTPAVVPVGVGAAVVNLNDYFVTDGAELMAEVERVYKARGRFCSLVRKSG